MPTNFVRTFAAITLLVSLAACGTPEAPSGINDPYEASNRRVHAFNKGLDRNVIRPVANGYGENVPRPVRAGLSNFGEFLRTPRYILNDLAQGSFRDAGHNFARFGINTIIGFGLLDAASDMGVEPRPTGFGETLHVWGAEEGAYVELPVLGPSTTRDTVGIVVDILTNPVSPNLESSQRAIPPSLAATDALDTRYRLGTTIDGIYYESADSYAQAREIYLQNRRFELGQESEDLEFDPYAEF